MTERIGTTSDRQLRLPRKIVVQDGDVVEALKHEGIVRVTFMGGLEVSIEQEPFPVDSKGKKRALAALGKLLDPYVAASLTESGWRPIDDQKAVGASTERGTMEEGLKRSFGSLLNHGLKPAEIEGYVRVLVGTKARGSEVHIGEIHPNVESVISNLADVLSAVVEEREHKPTVATRPLQARMAFGR